MKHSIFLLAVSAALTTAASAGVVIVPASGFDITWNGNDGTHFDSTPPPGGAVVPNNFALASNGGMSFTSSDLGPQLSIPFHVAANLNDGFYGNANSWISADSDPGPQAFGGVLLGSTINLTSVAWGRDNGNDGGDCCGGQLSDRTLGVYTLQFTADNGQNWTTIGTLDYQSNDDTVLGGGFTSHFRHEYGVSLAGGAPIAADGVRILVPAAGLGAGTAIDEIEIYGTQIPEPSSLLLALVGLCGFLVRRRRA